MASVQARVSHIFVRQAQTYSVGVIIRWRWLERAVKPLFEAAALHVLDVGCGDGTTITRLAWRYPNSTFLGWI